jgi:hypothetical protein
MEQEKSISKERALRDFPWLWAIKNWWTGNIIIKAQTIKESSDPLSFFSRKIISETDELWIHCTSMYEQDWVEKIKHLKKGSLISNSILQLSVFFAAEVKIHHIVFVMRDKIRGDWITVYRPPKPYVDLKKYLNEFFTKEIEIISKTHKFLGS